MQKHEQNPSASASDIKRISLQDSFAVLRKRQSTIVTFLVLTVLIVAIGAFSMTPTYKASSQVLIDKNLGQSGLENAYSLTRYDPQFLDTQFKIITSSNVIERVVQELQLDTKYKYYFLKKETRVSLFFKSFKQKIVDFFHSTNMQKSLLPEKNPDDRLLLKKIEPISDSQRIVKGITKNLKIRPERNTKIVTISYSHRIPSMAKLVSEALIVAYKVELQEIKHSSSNDTLKWMTKKSEQERKKLEESELALQAYMKKNDLVTIENKLAIYPQKLEEFSSQLSIIQAERKKLESIYSQITVAEKYSRDLETIPVFADSKVLQSIRNKIYTAQQNIKQLSKTYGYKNPVMINAKEELSSLKREKKFEIKRITDSTKNALDLAVSQENNITELLNTTKNGLLTLNEKFVQYSIMQREVNTNSVLYDTLTAGLKKASVTKQAQNVNVWVIKKAITPQHPAKPKKTLYLLLAIVFGFLGGVGLAFFFEYLDNTVNSPDDIEKRLALTVLGAIEDLEEKGQDVESFLLQEPLSPFAESYRLIRSSILLSSVDHPPRRILVTSMGPSEGKTSTTVNIARVLSQSNKKVVIVDCDMRKPRQHTLFSIPNSIGLSSYLTGNVKGQIIQQVPGEEISLITAGPTPPNPAELLDSKKMEKLLDRLAESYDFVLLDSPPILSVTDSLFLSTIADGTIVVVRAGKTTYEMIENGMRKLESIHAYVLGVVLNAVNTSKGSKEYYHGYYKYYNKDEKKKNVN